MSKHDRLVKEFLDQQMTLGDSPEGRCDDCYFRQANHSPYIHCLRSHKPPPERCSDYEEIEVLPVYTLEQLGFRQGDKGL